MNKAKPPVFSMQKAGRLVSSLFLVCLLACAASGLILLVQYRPMGDVFQNVEQITTLAPYGFFFRRLHYFSGQACAILALAHMAYHLWLGTGNRMRPVPWLRLVGGLAVCLALVLTGFILKGDQEARFAATVLQALAGSVPIAGGTLSGLVAGRGETFFYPPFVWHCLALPLLLYLLLRGHVRSWTPDRGILIPAGFGLAIVCLLLPLPLPLTPGTPMAEATGPWFLVGLQEMLRHAPPLVAGVAAPLGGIVLLGLLPWLKGRARRTAMAAILAGTAGYAALSLKMVLA